MKTTYSYLLYGAIVRETLFNPFLQPVNADEYQTASLSLLNPPTDGYYVLFEIAGDSSFPNFQNVLSGAPNVEYLEVPTGK